MLSTTKAAARSPIALAVVEAVAVGTLYLVSIAAMLYQVGIAGGYIV